MEGFSLSLNRGYGLIRFNEINRRWGFPTEIDARHSQHVNVWCQADTGARSCCHGRRCWPTSCWGQPSKGSIRMLRPNKCFLGRLRDLSASYSVYQRVGALLQFHSPQQGAAAAVVTAIPHTAARWTQSPRLAEPRGLAGLHHRALASLPVFCIGHKTLATDANRASKKALAASTRPRQLLSISNAPIDRGR